MAPLHRQSANLLLLASAFALLFSPGLVWEQIPAFRDAFHFYYPQIAWLDGCVSQGELFPTWNRYDGLGCSATGQVSTAIYYPPRVVWHLPWLSLPQRFSLFVVLHLALAAVGIFLAARHRGLSTEAATLSAAAYSLSCPVFFQHNNLIYLTSAAWIGFVLLSMSMRDQRYWLSVAICSTALSMMMLGGDPHTAANSVLVLAFCSLFSVINSHKKQGQQFLRQVGWLAIICVLSMLTTTAQWLPAMRWAGQSQRVVRSDKSSMDEATVNALRDASHRDLAELLNSIHLNPVNKFEFSASPLHLSTCLWPTLGGHYAPENSRWFAAIPSEGRMWLPSLYFGVLPLLFVFAKPRRRLEKQFDYAFAGLAWVAVISLLASMGNYSIIWIVREILTATGYSELSLTLPADSVGSIYGFLSSIVPGYDGFRYPAKWTVWFVAPVALLAGRGLQRRMTASIVDPPMPTGKTSSIEKQEHTEHADASDEHRDFVLQSSETEPSLCTEHSPMSVHITDAAENPDARLLHIDVPLKRWLRLVYLLVSLALILAGILVCVTPLGESLMRQLPHDAWLGKATAIPSGKTIIIAGLIPLFVFSILAMLSKVTASRIVALTIVEMTLAAGNWIAFTEAPSAETIISVPAEEAFVWANIARANIQEHTDTSETNLLRQITLQETFQLGKLSTLVRARNLAAIQSIDAIHVEKLRGYLFALDDLSIEQPELDGLLGSLGVTHRLYLDKDSREIKWTRIKNGQPLCSLTAVEQGSAAGSIANVQWEASNRLTIEVNAASESTLVVRQLNDGGWVYQTVLIDTVEDERPLSKAPLESPPTQRTLFIEIPVHAGQQTVVLKRRWFW